MKKVFLVAAALVLFVGLYTATSSSSSCCITQEVCCATQEACCK